MRQVGWMTLCLVAVAAPGRAQSAANITLQLPSFTQTVVSTTVVVPDRGTTSLSGSGRANQGTSRFSGWPRGRAMGANRQAGGTRVAARVHDPRAADAALREQARSHRGEADVELRVQNFADRAAVDLALPSVVALERRREGRQADRQREVQAAIARGRRALAAGNATVATLHFRSAVQQAEGVLRLKIEKQLRLLADESQREAPVNDSQSP